MLGEELGLVGTLLVLGLFLTIAYAGIRVAIRTKDPFVRYMSAGITIWLTAQMMINVGMVLALLPVIGLPLPLVSYGGSALLPSLVALGLLVSFARSEPGAKAALRARRRRRSAGVTAGGGLPGAARHGAARDEGAAGRRWHARVTPRRCSPPPTRCAVSTPRPGRGHRPRHAARARGPGGARGRATRSS